MQTTLRQEREMRREAGGVRAGEQIRQQRPQQDDRPGGKLFSHAGSIARSR